MRLRDRFAFPPEIRERTMLITPYLDGKIRSRNQAHYGRRIRDDRAAHRLGKVRPDGPL